MKNLKLLALVVFVAVLISCAPPITKITPLDVKPTPVMTTDQIKALDDAETKKIQADYQAATDAENAALAGQPKVSNVFVETDIKAALMDISNQTGINVIADASVEGSISVTLKNVPLERALRMVLFPGGYKFKYVSDGKYYLVGKSLPENPSFDTLSNTKVIKTNALAEVVAAQLSEHYRPYITTKGGNILVVTAPAEIMSRLEKDIQLVDRTKRMIEISAKFVVVQWENSTNLGMTWGDLNLDFSGAGNFAKGAASVFTGNFLGTLSNMFSAKGYKAKVDIVAEPRIVVEDGCKGDFKVVEEHIFMLLSGGGAFYNYFTTKDVNVGITMDVTPTLTRNGLLRLQIKPEVADIIGEREFKVSGGSSQKLPIVARRSETTTVIVDNGKTIAIGGLVMKSTKTAKTGPPLLSELPLLGGDQKEQKDTELVIFITAKVIG